MSILNMYICQKTNLKGLTAKEYNALLVLCRFTKNMVNIGLYQTRQHFFAEGQHLSYESIDHIAKKNENYKLIDTDIAQQHLKVFERFFQSFLGLWKRNQKTRYIIKYCLKHQGCKVIVGWNVG